jgi:PhzF family phenazine biosynthesis protein
MEIAMDGVPILQVDAFTSAPFRGNPAAVCFLDDERDAVWMQSVAAEMNLSETAFVRPLAEGFGLRWFTPKVEVGLCGHATLASAHAIWLTGRATQESPLRFHTQSGVLTATQSDGLIHLDFPATPVTPCDAPAGLIEAMALEPTFIGHSKFDVVLSFDEAAAVRRLAPDFRRLATVDVRGVIATAPSDDSRFDFISRFFAPAAGVDEDPVTGSAHCCLGPYWSEQLGKPRVVGFQASPRGGVVQVETRGDRVTLSGQAVTVLHGELLV